LKHDDGRVVTLTARADRIDLLAGGDLALLDYKTGKPPSTRQVGAGEKPQLTLEAAIAARGGFREVPQAEAEKLVYWRLSGGPEPGAVEAVKATPPEIQAMAEDALKQVRDLAGRFLWGQGAFLARPHPARRPAGEDFDHLSRLAEWAGAEDAEDST
jgi:ATP-dependent helicase/nuclease subunit B